MPPVSSAGALGPPWQGGPVRGKMGVRMLPELFLSATLLFPAPDHAERTNFDLDWRFALGHATDAKKDFGFADGSFSAFAKAGTNAGPIGLGFNDRGWRTVDLPHDWAIELPFESKADLMHGYKPVGRDYPENSVGWYRKRFVVPKEDEGRRYRITFDGIFRDALIFVNGHYLGRNESGYIGATFDLSDYVRYGGENVIAVRVDASYMEGWFYEGAGIYRHVWLHRSGPVSFVEDGTFFETNVVTDGTVHATSEVRNDGDEEARVAYRVQLTDGEGKVVASAPPAQTTIPPRSTRTFTADLTVAAPKRWSVDEPTLYTAEATIGSDTVSKAIGFRTFRFDPDKGFFLNDRPLRIQGTCNHQDHAGVGAAVPDRVNAWRVAQLKKFGCNFYRTSHNPPTPEVLDACDRLGVMVLDETRVFGSTGEALSQLERMVRRDRNHPSVIFWSIGNEEWATHGTAESARMARTMMAAIRALDPTRPVTYGGNNGAETSGINSVVDVRGFNYNIHTFDEYRRARPDQPIHGSETASTVTTRGEYADDPVRAYKKSYDHKGVDWGNSAEEWWRATLERPWFAGGFVWTGFDYRGEPTPYAWPNVNSHFGILDSCGFPKDVAGYYRAWWTNEPVLHVFPHWNWPGMDGRDIEVWAFSNHDEVELSVNGKSLGRQKVERGGHVAWTVPYAPGKLAAKGYRNGKAVQETVVETVGAPASLLLETEHTRLAADGSDAAVVIVRAIDAKGRQVPLASNLVSFTLTGPGRILGVGNGDPSCHEPDTLVTSKPTTPITGWRFKAVEGSPESRPEAKPGFDVSEWATVGRERYQLRRPNTVGVFVATPEVPNPEAIQVLDLGPVDDLGWVYLNGELIGTTRDWSASHAFSVVGKLKKGPNHLAIVCQNEGGQGGYTGEAAFVGKEPAPAYQRSLFHGLAQVIVRSGREPGTLTLRATAPGLEPASLRIATDKP
ncbi:MAG: DUF4982 domain-containing protein [Fimbriimonadaceae bacterium]|nr:DUF4982 domain-containing protein [Fimbriimonadaceae bacterium]